MPRRWRSTRAWRTTSPGWLRAPGRAALLFGDRSPSLTRSLRVSNGKFRGATGWSPAYRSAREGWIATANSFLPVPLPDWFQGEFDTPFRADRLRERLAEKSDWTPAGLAALQGRATALWAKLHFPRHGGGHGGDAAKAWVARSVRNCSGSTRRFRSSI